MDAKGIVTLGLWPTTISELNPQIISFGYMGSLEAVISALAKIKRWVSLKRKLKV